MPNASSEFRVPSSAAVAAVGNSAGKAQKAAAFAGDSAASIVDRPADTARGATCSAGDEEVVSAPDSEKPYLPFANGFPTPSGKAELYSEALKAQGLDPVAAFVAPRESRHVANEYPLEMLARKADNFLNTTFVNLPTHQAMEPENDILEISRPDAAKRRIVHGDRVRVFNGRGSIELTARVDGKVQPGVVAAKLGWAKLADKGQNINVLTSERLTDIGGGPTFYSCMVEVERIIKTQGD
jgi:anaerobic selenocysteine-containing dehydrogenase